MNFIQFLKNYISISIIAGIFTYRLLSVIKDNLVYPLINLVFNEHTFYAYNISLNEDHELVLTDPTNPKNYVKHYIGFGTILRELIIWVITMFILFLIESINKK